jgi:hypothetical protein
MTRQRTTSEIFGSITGGLMVGLGLHILSGNVDRATTQLSQSLGINTGEVLGLVPSAVLAASQAARVFAGDHFGAAQSLLSMLLAFWPLLLVIAGVMLLRDVFNDKVDVLPQSRKYFQNKDLGCRFCCPSLDA